MRSLGELLAEGRAEATYGFSPALNDIVERTPWKAGRESAIGRLRLHAPHERRRYEPAPAFVRAAVVARDNRGSRPQLTSGCEVAFCPRHTRGGCEILLRNIR